MSQWFTKSGATGILIGVCIALMPIFLHGCSGPKVDRATVESKTGSVAGSAGCSLEAADGLPGLITLLESSGNETRTLAAETIGRIGPSAIAAIQPLKARLADDSSHVRLAAANALSRIDQRGDSILSMVNAAKVEQESDVRGAMWNSAGLMTAGWNSKSVGDAPLEFPAAALTTLSGDAERILPEDGQAILSGLSSAGNLNAPGAAVAAAWLQRSSAPEVRSSAISLLGKTSSNNSASTNALISALRNSDEVSQTEISETLAGRELSISQQTRSSLYYGLASTTESPDLNALKRSLQPHAGIAVSQLFAEAEDASSPEAVRSGAVKFLRHLLTSSDGGVGLAALTPEQQAEAKTAIATVNFENLSDADAKAEIATLVSYLGEHPHVNEQLLAAASNVEVDDASRMEALSRLPQGALPNVAEQLMNDLEFAIRTAGEADDPDVRVQLQQTQLVALNKHGNASIAPKIAALMSSQENPALSIVALDTVVSLDPNSDSTAALVSSSLKAKDSTLVSTALTAAGLLSPASVKSVLPQVTELLSDKNHQNEALNTLGLQSKQAGALAGDIAEAMARSDDRKFRAAALEMLSGSQKHLQALPTGQSDKLVAALTSTLGDSDAGFRQKSLGLLNESGILKDNATKYPDTVTTLTTLATADTPAFRTAALRILAEAGKLPDDTKNTLAGSLSKAANAGEAKLILTALNNNTTSGAEIQKHLEQTLANPNLTAEAEQLSAALGDRQVSALASLTASGNEAARKTSFEILLKLSETDDGKSQLSAAQKSDDANVRAIASLMTGELPPGGSVADQQKTFAAALAMPSLAGQAKQLVSKMGRASVNPLSAIAKDADVDAETRAAAIELLASENGDDAAWTDSVANALEDVMASAPGRAGSESALALAKLDPMSKVAHERLATDISRQIPGIDRKDIVASLKHMAANEHSAAIASLSTVVTNEKLPLVVKQQAFDAILSQDRKLEPVQQALANVAESDDGKFGIQSAVTLMEVDPSSDAATNRLATSIASKDNADGAEQMLSVLIDSSKLGNDQAIVALSKVVRANSTPAAVRSSAFTAITESQSKSPAIKAALEAIATDLKHESATEAAIALAARDPKSAIAAKRLAAVAGSEHPDVSAMTIFSALHRMTVEGNNLAPAGIAALALSQKTPAAVSEQAVMALATAKDSPESAAAMKTIIANDSDVGIQAALALARVNPKSQESAQRISKAISSGDSSSDVQTLIDAVGKMDTTARYAALESLAESANENGVTPTMLALAQTAGINSAPAAALVNRAITDGEGDLQASALKMAKQMNAENARAVQAALWKDIEGTKKQSAAKALIELAQDPKDIRKLTEMSLTDADMAKHLPSLLSRQPDGGLAALESILAESKDANRLKQVRSQLEALSKSESGQKQLEKLLKSDAPGSKQLVATLMAANQTAVDTTKSPKMADDSATAASKKSVEPLPATPPKQVATASDNSTPATSKFGIPDKPSEATKRNENSKSSLPAGDANPRTEDSSAPVSRTAPVSDPPVTETMAPVEKDAQSASVPASPFAENSRGKSTNHAEPAAANFSGIILNPGERLISVNGVPVSQTKSFTDKNSLPRVACGNSTSYATPISCCKCRFSKCRSSRQRTRSWKRCRCRCG